MITPKQYVNLIHKIAQDIGDDTPAPVPARPAVTPGKPVVSPAPGGDIGSGGEGAPSAPAAPHGASISNQKVADMQRAIQDLALEVTRDSISKTLGPKPQSNIPWQGSSSVVAAKKGFNDFIAEQYLGALDEDKRGVEWTADSHVTSHPGKKVTQSDPYELDVVMNTMQRIGAGAKEFQADGNWQFRTDNALRNILGFAYALLQLDSDFGLDSGTKIYGLDAWRQFQKLLSGYQVVNGQVKMSPADKSKRAEQIIPHLKSITKLYHDFRLKVTSNPSYRPLLEGDRGYEKYDKVGTSTEQLTPEEDQVTKSPDAIVPGLMVSLRPHEGPRPIPLMALTSKDAYLAWMKEKGIGETQATSVFHNQIEKFVNALKG